MFENQFECNSCCKSTVNELIKKLKIMKCDKKWQVDLTTDRTSDKNYFAKK